METRAGSAGSLHLGANGVFPKWTFRKFAAVRHCLVGGGKTGGAGRGSECDAEPVCLSCQGFD